ncbi:hypothetical protein N7532_011202 [Penicillium argentinense]|uniref:Uncharacterized protein n=1 Tax=Penicillium argentinense TaxID=1131581 RepID=A0A9W9EHZ9_9EURO|nr:uncharacterized protein N7532_011202 [Penicillium argentinense]KAJ5082159.1 hypothetical protein N7532_011202 [Penicillium argentinense]
MQSRPNTQTSGSSSAQHGDFDSPSPRSEIIFARRRLLNLEECTVRGRSTPRPAPPGLTVPLSGGCVHVPIELDMHGGSFNHQLSRGVCTGSSASCCGILGSLHPVIEIETAYPPGPLMQTSESL